MLLALLLAPLASLAAPPPCTATVEDLHARIGEALEAGATMDTDALFAAQRGARQAVGCLRTLLEPEDAAAFHGVSGLAAYLTEDDAATVAAFRAALAADPTWHLPLALAPDGSPLARLQAEAMTGAESPRSPIGAAPGFFVVIDGEPTLERPADRPCVVQVADEGWNVLWSGALGPEDPLPEAALDPARFARGSSAVAQVLGERGGFERTTTQRMAWGAAGLGAGAAGLFAASAITAGVRVSRQRACIEDAGCVADEDDWTEGMDRLHRSSTALGWTGAACGVLGAGLGVFALVEGRF